MKRYNHLAIFVTSLLHMAIGFIWFSPYVFFPAWQKAFSITVNMDKVSFAPFILAFLAAITYNYFYSWLMIKLNIRRLGESIELMLVIWISVIGLRISSNLMFAQVGLTGILIEIGAIFANFLVSAIILNLWKKN